MEDTSPVLAFDRNDQTRWVDTKVRPLPFFNFCILIASFSWKVFSHLDTLRCTAKQPLKFGVKAVWHTFCPGWWNWQRSRVGVYACARL